MVPKITIFNQINKTKLVSDNFKLTEYILKSKLGNHSFKLELITPFSLSKKTDKLNTNKTTGVDGIEPRMLKMCKDHISLFNINESFKIN